MDAKIFENMPHDLKSIFQDETIRIWLIVSILLGLGVYYAMKETDPNQCYQKGLQRLAHTYGPDDYEAAASHFSDAIALKPDFAEAYYQRGLANQAAFASTLAAHKNQIIADYDKAIALNPNLAEVYYWRALARNQMQIYDTQNCENIIAYQESVKDLKTAIALKPTYTDAIHLLGHWQFCRAEYEQAIKNLKLAIEQNDFYNQDYDKIEAFGDLALSYSKLKDYRQALKTYDILIEFRKKVLCTDLDTNFIKLYRERIAVKKQLGISTFEDENAIDKIEENERYQHYDMPPVGI